MARPRRPGSTKAATAVAPHTVTTPNPSPRSAASAVTAHSRSVARWPNAGSPSNPDPSTSVQRHPRPVSTRRIDSWARTVQAIMTPVTSPAPRSSLPPRITQSGATEMSSAKPENQSAAEPSSQGMPGTRQTEPDPGAPGAPAWASPLPWTADAVSPVFPARSPAHSALLADLVLILIAGSPGSGGALPRRRPSEPAFFTFLAGEDLQEEQEDVEHVEEDRGGQHCRPGADVAERKRRRGRGERPGNKALTPGDRALKFVWATSGGAPGCYRQLIVSALLQTPAAGTTTGLAVS